MEQLNLSIFTPSSKGLTLSVFRQFKGFLQMMTNRIIVGEQRYGAPNAAKTYLTRLQVELQAYRKTGNTEHLYNIANYAFLESVAPEHKRQTFDPAVDSVTRKRTRKRKEGE